MRALDRFIEWFISNQKIDRELKYKLKLLVTISLLLNILVLFLWLPLSRVPLFDASMPPLFILLISSWMVLWSIKKGYPFVFSALIIPVTASLLIPYSTFQIGFLNSPPTRWFPLIPLVTSFFLGAKYGVLFGVLTILGSLLLAWNLPFANITPEGNSYEIDKIFATSDLISEIVFVSLLAIIYEIKRLKYVEEITRTKDLLTDSNKIAKIGGWTYDLTLDNLIWSEEAYALLGIPLDTQISTKMALNFFDPEHSIQIRRVLLNLEFNKKMQK
ncbi:MAG: hypothetical protein AB8G05_02550 [Oligoflexales bacterium]